MQKQFPTNKTAGPLRQLLKFMSKFGVLVLLLLAFSAQAITLKQAARQVANQYNGKVVSAYTTEQHGRRIHVIRVVTEEGVVKTVRIPE